MRYAWSRGLDHRQASRLVEIMELSVDRQSGISIVKVTGSVDSADSGDLLSFFNDHNEK